MRWSKIRVARPGTPGNDTWRGILWLGGLVVLCAAGLAGCSGGGTKSADSSGPPRASATEAVRQAADFPAGKLVFVGFIREWTGRRDLVLHVADADGSNGRDIDGQLNGADALVSVIPGTQRIIYPACDSTCHARIYDLGTGERRDVVTAHKVLSVAVSRDGHSLAYASGEAVYVAGIDGSGERELFRYPPESTVFGLGWAPDGQSLSFLAGVKGLDPVMPTETRDVYVVSTTGGSPVQMGTIGRACNPLADARAAACAPESAVAGVRVDLALWARDGSYLVLSGRERDGAGAWDTYAAARTPDGQPAPADAKVSRVCALGGTPGICGVTYLFDEGGLALLRVGGTDLQIVDLAGPRTAFTYRLGPPDKREGDLAAIRTAVWVAAPASEKASTTGR